MKLTIGISPCPNDTFMFEALLHGRVPVQGVAFQLSMADVEQLNQLAFQHQLDITKLSYHAYAHVAKDYQLLTTGSALGFKNGPLLISKQKIYPDEVEHVKIAIPGAYTTANLLLGLAYPGATRTREYLFSDIEEAVLSGEQDAGLIIHENRFTYHDKGLKKIADLGAYWEKETGMPIPLGGIVIKRGLPERVKRNVNKALGESIRWGQKFPGHVFPFMKKYAQEMEETVMKKHVDLYVNEFSMDIGEMGKDAIQRLYREAMDKNIIPPVPENIFVEP